MKEVTTYVGVDAHYDLAGIMDRVGWSAQAACQVTVQGRGFLLIVCGADLYT
jgi:hypothetical protein